MKNLKEKFINYCKINKFEVNQDQIKIINSLSKFYNLSIKNNFFFNLFKKKTQYNGIYLFGDVGVGKTMLLTFFYNNIKLPKVKMHFNEFMISFHDFIHKNKKMKKDDPISLFVKNIKKKYKIIYFDEFQVTNIVDAMILGKLFKTLFQENIKIIITSNNKIVDLYKDGLQREQFIPFIKIMNKACKEIELVIKEDYRKSESYKQERFFFPLNEETNFKINQKFRKITKDYKHSIKKLEIKGRIFKINNYYEKFARFEFNELCNNYIGAEDYINIANICNFIVIENIPLFNESNSNQQQRFITLIDILYEKKVLLMVSSISDLKNLSSSRSLLDPFKRTISRLHELTSNKFIDF